MKDRATLPGLLGSNTSHSLVATPTLADWRMTQHPLRLLDTVGLLRSVLDLRKSWEVGRFQASVSESVDVCSQSRSSRRVSLVSATACACRVLCERMQDVVSLPMLAFSAAVVLVADERARTWSRRAWALFGFTNSLGVAGAARSNRRRHPCGTFWLCRPRRLTASLLLSSLAKAY